MTGSREDLDAAHTAVLTRHWQALVGNGGRPTPGLLADLAAVAEEHADSILTQEMSGVPGGGSDGR